MEWFYEKDHEVHGPVSEEEMQALRDAGVVTPETLVWFAGLKDWKRYEEAVAFLPKVVARNGEKPLLTPRQ